MISQLMHNILLASLSSGLLVILFIFLRKIIVRNIGATWNYYLWFAVFIPWFSIWIPLHSLSSRSKVNFNIIHKSLATLSTAATQIHLSLPDIFVTVWLSGLLFCSLYILFKHLKFILLLKKNSRLIMFQEQKMLKEILIPHQYKYLSRIYLSTAVSSPLLCHVIKPKIYLPNNFFHDYTGQEQKYVLQHECTHLRRYDLLSNMAMISLSCVNWFNPIMLFAYRYFLNAQELSCDAVISQRLSSLEKKTYGYALLKTVINQSFQTPIMSCSWNTRSQLKERCQMLQFHHSKPIKAFLGIAMLITVTCVAIAAPNIENQNIQITTGITFLANNVYQTPDGHESILNGNVLIKVGDWIKISADKAYVTYLPGKKHAVNEFIIDGKGLFDDGNHITQFTNGVFDPNTLHLSGEEIKRLH